MHFVSLHLSTQKHLLCENGTMARLTECIDHDDINVEQWDARLQLSVKQRDDVYRIHALSVRLFDVERQD